LPVPSFLLPMQRLTNNVAAHLTAPTGGSSGKSGSLSFSIQPQEQTEWCWSAVSVSVANFFGTATWRQCTLAAAELSPLNCCGGDGPVGPPNGCNKPWSLDTALSRVGHYAHMVTGTQSFSVVQQEITAGRPICCRIEWAGNLAGAHFVAVAGWSVLPDGTEYLEVYDPNNGVFTQKVYADFCSAYQSVGDRWSHSYFTQAGGPGALAGGAVPAQPSPVNA
jgi:hypothetical protein